MTSREIAELTGKRHDNVVADIRNMLNELDFDLLSFQGIYLDSRNREQIEYRLNKDLTETLITGYSTKLRYQVVRRLNYLEDEVKRLHAEALERALTKQIASTMTNLRDAADLMNKTQGSKTFPQKAKGIHELLEKLRRACSNDLSPDEAEDLYQRVSEGLVHLGVAKQDGGLKAQAFVTKLSDVLRLYGKEVALSYARTSATGQAEP